MTSASKTKGGEALRALLSARGVSQYKAAKVAQTSQGYFNQVVSGKRLASAAWLDTVSCALSLSDDERLKLHRAAALDHGFKIDLS